MSELSVGNSNFTKTKKAIDIIATSCDSRHDGETKLIVVLFYSCFFIFTFLHISTLYITTGVLDYSHKVRLSFNIIIHLVDNTLKLHCKKTYSTHRIMRNKGVMVALKRSPGATE